MKISHEQKLALKISFILLVVVFGVSNLIQFLNHNWIVNFNWSRWWNKYIIFVISSIIIYFVSFILAKMTIRPIKENNKKLKEYNHNLAHEIKTPLCIISSNLELLEIEYDKKIILSSKEEIKNIEEITDSLLFLSENSKLKDLETVSFRELFWKCDNSDLEVHIKNDFVIYGDRALLESLVRNIIKNSYKYKKINTKVQVTVDKNSLRVSNKTDWKIDINDTSKLFDTFYKLDNSRNTSGFWLGLSIVKKICDLHRLKVKIIVKDDLFAVDIEK